MAFILLHASSSFLLFSQHGGFMYLKTIRNSQNVFEQALKNLPETVKQQAHATSEKVFNNSDRKNLQLSISLNQKLNPSDLQPQFKDLFQFDDNISVKDSLFEGFSSSIDIFTKDFLEFSGPGSIKVNLNDNIVSLGLGSETNAMDIINAHNAKGPQGGMIGGAGIILLSVATAKLVQPIIDKASDKLSDWFFGSSESGETPQKNSNPNVPATSSTGKTQSDNKNIYVTVTGKDMDKVDIGVSTTSNGDIKLNVGISQDTNEQNKDTTDSTTNTSTNTTTNEEEEKKAQEESQKSKEAEETKTTEEVAQKKKEQGGCWDPEDVMMNTMSSRQLPSQAELMMQGRNLMLSFGMNSTQSLLQSKVSQYANENPCAGTGAGPILPPYLG